MKIIILWHDSHSFEEFDGTIEEAVALAKKCVAGQDATKTKVTVIRANAVYEIKLGVMETFKPW